MRLAAVALLFGTGLGLAGCGGHKEEASIATRAGPGPSYTCLVPGLSAAGLRQETEATPEGWRMKIAVFTGPPAGWYDKGRIEYATGTLAYIPNTATLGIADKEVRQKLGPLVSDCRRAHR